LGDWVVLVDKIYALIGRGLLVLLFLVGGRVTNVRAQTAVTTIDSLAVDIWPDYDRAAVLVLLTGFLPADTPLPATITIPLPDDADLNAVARITAEGNLFDDIAFDESIGGQVTLTTPDPRFRIEYYMPYTLEGNERSFSFEWESDLAVGEILVSVQQPVATDDLTTEPAAFSVTPRQDGFQYHNLSPVEVPAGESFTLTVTYSRAVSQLSAELLQPAETTETTTANQPEPPTGTSLNWQTVLIASGGVAVLAVGAWMLFGERLVAAKSRPAPVSTRPKKRERERESAVSETPTFVQFCHHCGQKTAPADRFCRSCGTRLKNQ
jgi:hypothetical protein